MRKRTELPAGTRCSREALCRIYKRQFEELAPLRRHILSLLPLNRINSIFEPGCGTGLLGRQIMSLTDAVYTGMDINGDIIPHEGSFVQGDVLKSCLSGDMFVTGFFFSSLRDPVKWLKGLETDYFTVFSEYDYMSIEEDPPGGIAERLRSGLESDGLYTGHGGRLDEYFRRAGFTKLQGGDAESSLQRPDREFLELHIPELAEYLPMMSWRIVWGIWRKK